MGPTNKKLLMGQSPRKLRASVLMSALTSVLFLLNACSQKAIESAVSAASSAGGSGATESAASAAIKSMTFSGSIGSSLSSALSSRSKLGLDAADPSDITAASKITLMKMTLVLKTGKECLVLVGANGKFKGDCADFAGQVWGMFIVKLSCTTAITAKAGVISDIADISGGDSCSVDSINTVLSGKKLDSKIKGAEFNIVQDPDTGVASAEIASLSEANESGELVATEDSSLLAEANTEESAEELDPELAEKINAFGDFNGNYNVARCMTSNALVANVKKKNNSAGDAAKAAVVQQCNFLGPEKFLYSYKQKGRKFFSVWENQAKAEACMTNGLAANDGVIGYSINPTSSPSTAVSITEGMSAVALYDALNAQGLISSDKKDKIESVKALSDDELALRCSCFIDAVEDGIAKYLKANGNKCDSKSPNFTITMSLSKVPQSVGDGDGFNCREMMGGGGQGGGPQGPQSQTMEQPIPTEMCTASLKNDDALFAKTFNDVCKRSMNDGNDSKRHKADAARQFLDEIRQVRWMGNKQVSQESELYTALKAWLGENDLGDLGSLAPAPGQPMPQGDDPKMTALSDDIAELSDASLYSFADAYLPIVNFKLKQAKGSQGGGQGQENWISQLEGYAASLSKFKTAVDSKSSLLGTRRASVRNVLKNEAIWLQQNICQSEDRNNRLKGFLDLSVSAVNTAATELLSVLSQGNAGTLTGKPLYAARKAKLAALFSAINLPASTCVVSEYSKAKSAIEKCDKDLSADTTIVDTTPVDNVSDAEGCSMKQFQQGTQNQVVDRKATAENRNHRLQEFDRFFNDIAREVKSNIVTYTIIGIDLKPHVANANLAGIVDSYARLAAADRAGALVCKKSEQQGGPGPSMMTKCVTPVAGDDVGYYEYWENFEQVDASDVGSVTDNASAATYVATLSEYQNKDYTVGNLFSFTDYEGHSKKFIEVRARNYNETRYAWVTSKCTHCSQDQDRSIVGLLKEAWTNGESCLLKGGDLAAIKGNLSQCISYSGETPSAVGLKADYTCDPASTVKSEIRKCEKIAKKLPMYVDELDRQQNQAAKENDVGYQKKVDGLVSNSACLPDAGVFEAIDEKTGKRLLDENGNEKPPIVRIQGPIYREMDGEVALDEIEADGDQLFQITERDVMKSMRPKGGGSFEMEVCNMTNERKLKSFDVNEDGSFTAYFSQVFNDGCNQSASSSSSSSSKDSSGSSTSSGTSTSTGTDTSSSTSSSSSSIQKSVEYVRGVPVGSSN